MKVLELVRMVRTLLKDPLHRNAFFLMLATAALSGFGFLFWTIVAHLFVATDVGLATTLISTMNLISLLSLAGFNLAFVRFLPGSSDRNTLMNTGLLLVAIVSATVALGFAALVPWISPGLDFIRAPLSAALFALLCMAASVNTLTDSVFLAAREARYTCYINAAFSFLRLAFPLFFVGRGAVGIFAAAGLAQVIGVVLSIAAMTRRFGYEPRLMLDMDTLRRVWRYAAGNYAANVLGLVAPSVLPLLVLDRLGAEKAAYFYVAMMMANLLYVIPYAATRSLFAEGSNDEYSLLSRARTSLLATTGLVIPAIAVAVIAAPWALSTFGASYEAGGTIFLRLAALAALPIMLSATLTTIFQISTDVRYVIATSASGAIVTIGASFALVGSGLPGIGVALIIGPLSSAFVGLMLFKGKHLLAYTRETRDAWRTRLSARQAYQRARAANPRPRAILFYPHKPKPIHIAYAICHYLGYDIVDDPGAPHDAAFAFEDATIRSRNAQAIPQTYINWRCHDISKRRVEQAFAAAFGYGMSVDPRTHAGVCVRKSDNNAAHDGRVVMCPREPEQGYIYQRLIDNECGDGRVYDIRLVVHDARPLMAILRYRSIDDRFDSTLAAKVVPLENALSADETERIARFCEEIGLDSGEIDALRDRNGRIYIVDANNTPSGPTPGVHMSHAAYHNYISRMADLFAAHVVPEGMRVRSSRTSR